MQKYQFSCKYRNEVGTMKGTSRSSKTPTHPARYISAGVLDVGESPLQLRHHRGRWFVAAVVQRRSDPDYRRVSFTPDSPYDPEPRPRNERVFTLQI